MNATARLDTPEPLRGLVPDPERRGLRWRPAPKAAGLKPQQMRGATRCMLGGGFGRRGAVQDYVRQVGGDRQGDCRGRP